jgi:hypothetical protein
MIVRKVSFWTKEEIADALETFAGAGGVSYAYFYPDRVVMTARPLRDTRGLVTKVTVDEIITDGDAVMGRVYAAMHGNLLFRLRALEAESEEAKA